MRGERSQPAAPIQTFDGAWQDEGSSIPIHQLCGCHIAECQYRWCEGLSVVQMIDSGLADDKIIAVLQKDAIWGNLHDISELPAALGDLAHAWVVEGAGRRPGETRAFRQVPGNPLHVPGRRPVERPEHGRGRRCLSSEKPPREFRSSVSAAVRQIPEAVRAPGIAWPKPPLQAFARSCIHSIKNRLRATRGLLLCTRFQRATRRIPRGCKEGHTRAALTPTDRK